MATSRQIQPLKIPDAVVALAQAAAKANGETEKYLPGWPLFSPPKMQLTKCAKCAREFCSSIALRRHSRMHRRALKIDKERLESEEASSRDEDEEDAGNNQAANEEVHMGHELQEEEDLNNKEEVGYELERRKKD